MQLTFYWTHFRQRWPFAPGLRRALLLLLCATAMSPAVLYGQTRRAVIVGINEYAPTESTSGIALRKWKDLDGAVNDASTMASLLENRFEFDEITVLLNAEASRDAILSAINELADASSAGDVAVFYYAGHGSQVRNTATSEQDGLDETIVPSDAANGAQDIRDKELRTSFNQILDKGALLTLIFDSCHSGSITRGVPGGATRFIEPSSMTVDDPSNPPLPVDRGALVLSAAQDDELAKELLDADGNARGSFSWSLGRALLESSPDTPVRDIFLKARSFMKSRGISQEPVVAGQDDRMSSSLFGGLSNVERLDEVLVLAADENGVVLQGGLATGLRAGTELLNTAGNRFVVRDNPGMASSLAAPVDHQNLPSAGESLRIDRWMPAVSPVRIHIPSSPLQYDDLLRLENDVRTMGAIDDPTEESPVWVMYYDDGWTLSGPDGVASSPATPASRELVGLARQDGIGSADAPLHIELPAFKDLSERLLSDLSTMGLDAALTSKRNEADYLLTGRLIDGELRYGWVHREATAGDTGSPAPARTDWLAVPENPTAASTALARDVRRLEVIFGWLSLASPPDNGAFPYLLAGFEDVSDGSMVPAGDSLRLGSEYRAVLTASTQAIQDAQMQAVIGNVQKRFLYLFALDSNGNGSLLYPRLQDGNVENDINFFTFLPERLALPSEGPLFTVAPPIGIDTFFLLSSEEPIPDPGILNFSGVRTRAEPDGDQTDLSRLLFGVGEGQRSTQKTVPMNWSLQRVSVRTIDTP